MKKISILLLVVVAALSACKKTPEVNLKYVDVERDLITVGTTTATVQCDYEYITTLKKAFFYYGEGGEETDMNTAEMRVVQNTLYVDLTGLKENTTYSYYYEFVNGFNSMRTKAKMFKTETGNGGGDEPPTPPTPPSGVPEGAINGLFTINENGDQVYFSQGNLQYQASTNTWRFAEYQWDYVGGTDNNGNEYGTVYENGVKCSNNEISPTYSGWIDMFGWGTSGYNHGANCYQPWSISDDYYDCYAYGSPTSHLYEQSGKADWGYNAISNGGNQENLWRSLSNDEWDYLLNTRNTTSGIRFTKAYLNGVAGLVITPNNWDGSFYALSSTNDAMASYSSNFISLSDWNDMLQTSGVVFLPAAGSRKGTEVAYSVRVEWGQYWTASYLNEWMAYPVSFDEYHLDPPNGFDNRFNGQTVRLVQDANH